MGKMKSAYILVEKLEAKESLRRPRRRWEDNIIMYHRSRWEVVGWIHLAQDTDQRQALVNTIMNLHFP
jgi:hypothetical protein